MATHGLSRHHLWPLDPLLAKELQIHSSPAVAIHQLGAQPVLGFSGSEYNADPPY
ncbi:hypothetical protein SEA_SHAM4_32 [Mycobacterium phage Sham4]|uniref:hypothetical protein n=1 Tax=Mycobacterium phage Mulciber TaxID=1805459 RepID=UPI00078C5DED|nr:hypothetical protein BJD74_gp76 [Mycobacterium phage Mulciber]AQT28236.1 hypothetical protein SEA_JABITH_33 [Mycobacterium phage Jabith]ASR86670.1 hypothetical protein SEA_ET2BRUTUS_32 [Mycobacterium phage Et2Brutus]AXC33393.1 hypothetical protein SEA_EBONY_33 [Mycobacterium phage Ebony]AXC33492.1 hypothetical protein SEA_JOSELITO_33 [Mycobacterium phage Joselito]AXH50712.1 hypothetical protein SEA_SNAPE_32 [Mycobacterium phage Snape]QBI97866.1 hypothetical protein SEA_ORANGE_32 [Mycobacte